MKYTIRAKGSGRAYACEITGIPEESLNKWIVYLAQKSYKHYDIIKEKEK